MLQIPVILPAQLRHKTGEIVVPPEAEDGDYDLVLTASPTWWFQTSMPIRSYLETSGAKKVMAGKPFAFRNVSGYRGVCGYEVLMIHPFVDGYLFTRSVDANEGVGVIMCWDLRDPEGQHRQRKGR